MTAQKSIHELEEQVSALESECRALRLELERLQASIRSRAIHLAARMVNEEAAKESRPDVRQRLRNVARNLGRLS
jgi:regulator of replication initiation timing